MMKKAMKKIGLSAMLLLPMISVTRIAVAACTPAPTTGEVQFRSTVYSFGSGAISVPRDAAVGTVIARSRINFIDASGLTLRCSNANDLLEIAATAAPRFRVDGSNRTLLLQEAGRNTGVGLQVILSSGALSFMVGSRSITAGQLAVSNGQTPNPPIDVAVSDAMARDYAELVLIKTSDQINPGIAVTNGTLLNRTLNRVYFYHRLELLSNITIASQTCSVTMPSSVNLGNWRSTAFTGINSTTTAVNFNLDVNCTGLNTAVHMTMSDPSNNGNTGATLPLTAGSGATGVGVQVLRNNTPVRMGPDSSVRGNTNQFLLFNANSSMPTFNAAFQARYIQTANIVTPGAANSSVTVTMSYQ